MLRVLAILITSTILVALNGDGLPAKPVERGFYRNTVAIGSGAVSAARRGLFEDVARNRMAGRAEPTIAPDIELGDYDSLVATESCKYIGWSGLLIVTNGSSIAQRTVLVVDCQDESEIIAGKSLSDLGLLADVSDPDEILHWRGYLVLSPHK